MTQVLCLTASHTLELCLLSTNQTPPTLQPNLVTMDTVPKAVELVTKAIEADNAKVKTTTLASVDSVLKPQLTQKHEEALVLYKRSLEYFMVAIKCTAGSVVC